MAHVTLPPVLPSETMDIVMQVLLLLPPPPLPLTTTSDRRRWIHCRVVALARVHVEEHAGSCIRPALDWRPRRLLPERATVGPEAHPLIVSAAAAVVFGCI